MAYIKINKQNFFHNLNQFALKCGSKAQVGIVLKDNAYGHGLELMAALASEFGLTEAVVRSYAEAMQIKPFFTHILVLGDRACVDGQCSFALNSLEDINRAEKGSVVELKVDTGMHRNGVAMDALEKALARIQDRALQLKGVMTHNRSADALSSELFWQQKQFERVKQRVRAWGFEGVRFHAFNSASALRLGCADEEFIRVGIGAYGYNELPDCYETIELKPVLSLWAKRVASRTLNRGERVGYGGTFEAPRVMNVSSYDLGYGDGWMRSNSFCPFMTAEGLPLLGRVSMDYVVLESDKEEVCIMDDALAAARQVGTISYEMTTLLSPTIERVVV